MKQKKIRQAYIFIGIGICSILLSIVFHSFKIIHTSEENLLMINELIIQILSHIGIGFLAVGIISIMLDMDHWVHYFENRLKNIVVEKKYLSSLDSNSLISLQTEVLKAFFQNDSIGGSDGFLKHYQENIQSIIGNSFRINVNMNIQIKETNESEDCVEIFETLSYTCKQNKDKFQTVIDYIPDEGEHEKTKNFEVILQHQGLSNREGCDGNGKIIFDYEKLKNTEQFKNNQNGFNLNIDNYCINNLLVVVKANYLIKKHRFFAWRMAQPTRNLTLTINYPNNYLLQKEYFIHNAKIINDNESDGLYTLNINGWLMPNEGITFQIL